jgi:hypothetical protein
VRCRGGERTADGEAGACDGADSVDDEGDGGVLKHLTFNPLTI